jgi:hypothetical protein
MSSGPVDDPLHSESASSSSSAASGPMKVSLLLKSMFIFFVRLLPFFS